jgi:hypothetical protein
VIRSSNGGVWIVIAVEGNIRLAGFINRVTAQDVEWIGEFRQDILTTAND